MAELYPTRSWKRRAGHVTYKRFEVAAEALRFAMEELPSELLSGTYLEVGEERFNGRQIRLLYEDKKYPFPRKLPLSRPLQDNSTNRSPRKAADIQSRVRQFRAEDNQSASGAG